MYSHLFYLCRVDKAQSERFASRTMKDHTFPDKPTAHVCLMADLTNLTVIVSASETFGKALARLSISQDDILSYEVSGAPLHYEPDLSIASR